MNRQNNVTIYGAILFASMAIFYRIFSINTPKKDPFSYIQMDTTYWTYPNDFGKNLGPEIMKAHMKFFREKFPEQKKRTRFEIVLKWIKGCFVQSNSWEAFFYNILVAEFFFGILLGLFGFVVYRFIPKLFITILTKLGRAGFANLLERIWDLCRAFWRWNRWRGAVPDTEIFPNSGFNYSVYVFFRRWVWNPAWNSIFDIRDATIHYFLKNIWWKWFPPPPPHIPGV